MWTGWESNPDLSIDSRELDLQATSPQNLLKNTN